MARFIARPWWPPSSVSHAITRLIAGGWAKSWLNQAFATSKSFWTGPGYSEASLNLTVGIGDSFHSAGAGSSRVDQPASGPTVDRVVGVDRAGGDEPRHRARRLVGRHSEQPREQPLGGEHRTARVALDHAGQRGLARHPPAGGDRLRKPRLDQVPAVREGRLVTLLALDDPEPLLQLRHRPLELACVRRLEHEHVGPQ